MNRDVLPQNPRRRRLQCSCIVDLTIVPERLAQALVDRYLAQFEGVVEDSNDSEFKKLEYEIA
jgi:hypothetical protein